MGFFSNLFGGKREDKKKDEINRAETKSDNQLSSSYSDSYDTRQTGLSKSTDYYGDTIQTGKDAMSKYRDAVGLNGSEAYGAARDEFAGSDYFQGILKTGRETIEGSNTLGGELYSGNTLKELSDYGTNAMSGEWEKYVNYLDKLVGYGEKASDEAADKTQETYSNTASDQKEEGQDKSNVYLQSGAARADATNTTDYSKLVAQILAGLGSSAASYYSSSGKKG